MAEWCRRAQDYLLDSVSMISSTVAVIVGFCALVVLFNLLWFLMTGHDLRIGP